MCGSNTRGKLELVLTSRNLKSYILLRECDTAFGDGGERATYSTGNPLRRCSGVYYTKTI
jgi:hypothetical protein